MLRNNTLSFMIHGIIGFIMYIIFINSDSLLMRYSMDIFYLKVIAILTLLLSWVLYIASGRLLKRQDSKVKNIFSISTVSILGIILWTICFCLSGGDNLGSNLIWVPYVFFEAYSFPIVATFMVNPIIALLFAILPSLLFWLGMQFNKKDLLISEVDKTLDKGDNQSHSGTESKSRNVVIATVLLFVIVVLYIMYNILAKQILVSKPIIPNGEFRSEKPVIYLYPEKPTNVNVKIKFDGDLFVTYPKYNVENGWKVEARPDGKLINKVDGKEYSYLFWEGIDRKSSYKMNNGFVIEGKKTAEFLQDTLSKMGLTPKEYNEFIVYWVPRMIKNEFNLIYFAGQDYTEKAKLEVSPRPDSVLRVFMVFKKLNEKIEIEEQKLNPFERKGFSLIEWGGTEIQ